MLLLVAQNKVATYTLHQYTTENGLPSNLIRGIQWDAATGFLWVITEGGLVRMNGIEFKSYNKEKISPVAPEKQVFAEKNNQGVIYISDGSGNIFEIKNNHPFLSKPATLSNSFVNNHFIAVSNNFYNDKIKLPPVFNAPFENIVCLSDTSCLILFQNTIYKYSLATKAPVELYKNISALYKINNKCFFADNKKQNYLLNTVNFTTAQVSSVQPQSILLNNSSSQLFWNTGMPQPIIIKDNEAWLLDFENGVITTSLIADILPTDANISTVVYVKEQGMLFIGTDSKGIILIKQNLVQPKKRKNANPKNKNAYFSQVALDNGNILTNEGDVIGDNESSIQTLPINGKFSHRISLTNNNLLWYFSSNQQLGYKCLHQYNKSTGQTKAYDKIKLLTQVETIGATIYLSNNKGIGVLQGDSMQYLYQYPKDVSGINIYDFQAIDSNQLLVAGCSGMFKYNVEKHQLDTVYKNGNACFGSIWKYKDYIFWGSYGYGFFVYKNGLIKEMPLDKNEYLLYTHCFVSDNEGYCWISTNRGLFKAKIDDLINAYEKNNRQVYYHYYGKNDGMDITEMNGGCTPCALAMKGEIISFPTMDGLLWVEPKKATPILPDGEIFIDEIITDNNKINVDTTSKIILPANANEILIKLAYAAWCNKENIYIEYKINEAATWKKIDADNQATIRLSNLSSGNYILHIRKLNGYGTNNFSYKEIHFTITTPWYKKWWFYMLALVSLLGLILLFLEWRTKQYRTKQAKLEKQVAEKTKELLQQNEVLEKNNTIKTRLISIISHDIITPLKFLSLSGKNLQEKRKQMPDELQEETIQEITNTSKELQQLSTNILNWIKYQNEHRRLTKETFSVTNIVQQAFGLLNPIARQKQVTLINTVSNQLMIYQFFEPLKITIHNLVANAINFTEKGNVEVSAIETNGTIVITVKDNGVGMTPEQVKNILADDFIISSANMDNRKGNGLGYLIIKDLVKMMDAKLEIISNKTEGTRVSITLLKQE